MTRYKPRAKKKRLLSKLNQTKWAPFWTVPKIYGKTRKVHPGRHTVVKRNWRRNKIKA
jgi:ribosomal protein L39E